MMNTEENNMIQLEEEIISGEDFDGTIYVVYCKRKKRFDKYVKEKSEKLIIDINRTWSKDDGTEYSKSISFKVMVWRKMTIALEKGKTVYYIPNLDDPRSTPDKHLEMKKLFSDKIKFKALVFGYDKKNFQDFDEIEIID